MTARVIHENRRQANARVLASLVHRIAVAGLLYAAESVSGNADVAETDAGQE